MTVLEAIRQAQDIDWQRRVEFYIVKAAIAVHNEAPATAEHTARVALSELILADTDFWANRFAIGVATNATIQAGASLSAALDSDVEFTVNSILNSYTKSLAASGNGKGAPVMVSATLTRPANTTAYTAGDELTDTGGAILAFPGCVQSSGGSGILASITVIDAANAATDPQLDVFVFDTTSVPQADNAAFAPSDAVMNTLVTAVSMGSAVAGDAASTGNLLFQARNLAEPFTCVAGSTSLFVRLVMRNAYVPVSGEVFVVRLGICQT